MGLVVVLGLVVVVVVVVVVEVVVHPLTASAFLPETGPWSVFEPSFVSGCLDGSMQTGATPPEAEADKRQNLSGLSQGFGSQGFLNGTG